MAAKKTAQTKATAKAKAAGQGDGQSRLAAVLGFGLAALPAAAAVAVLLTRDPPPPLHVEAAEDTAAPLPVHYIDLPDPLSVAVTPKGPRVQLTLTVAVRGELASLLPLKDTIAAKGNLVLAAMLNEAQELVRDRADSERLHRELPERLRRVINGELGSESWPEPVEEVLITSVFVQE